MGNICSSKPSVYSPRRQSGDVESAVGSSSRSPDSASSSSLSDRGYHMDALANLSSTKPSSSIAAGRPRTASIPLSSPRSLQKHRDDLIRRIDAEGPDFRTTSQERADFKAAYIALHARDCNGGENSWEDAAWYLESLQQRRPELGHMKIEDMVALRAWTITGDYQTVQDVLDKNHPPTAHGLAYAKSIISAFHSLPDSFTHHAPVYSIGNQSPQWVNDRFRPGEIHASQRFFSAAQTNEAARQSKEATGHNPRVEWETHSASGKGISSFSLHPEEQEVLFLPGTRFLVADVSLDPERDKIYIRQQEV